MPEQDAVAQWKAFTPQQRQLALSKMTPEQKNALKAKFDAQIKPVQKPNPVGDTGVKIGASTGAMPTPKHHTAPLSETVPHAIEQKLEAAAPMVGATVGAFAGGPIGAGIGGAAGTFAQTQDPKAAAVSGVANMALEGAGSALGTKLSKYAATAAPKAAKLINDYIGLTSAKLPRFGRTLQNAQEIGKTVLEKVGVRPTLDSQIQAIESTRAAYDQATQKLIQAPGGKLSDVHSALYNRAVDLLNHAEKEGVTREQLNAIDKNLEALLKAAKPGGMMTPAEMLAMRKNIQSEITDWNPNTINLRQRFLQGTYHDLNDAITRSLPAKESRQFLANNRIQSKLITARDAAKSKLLTQGTTPKPGPVTKAARTAGKVAIGATGGAVVGGESGHGKQGALTGAVLGAAAGAGLSAADAISLPGKDVAATRALGKVAGKLAPVAKATPQVVRTLRAIQAVQSRPQQ